MSGRENAQERKRERAKEISYRDKEKEDKDDSWLGTLCIWQGWLVEP